MVDAGSISAALLTEKENIYVDVCIATACSLGMCVERNEIVNMITNDEKGICQLITVARNRKVILLCGACWELTLKGGYCGEKGGSHYGWPA